MNSTEENILIQEEELVKETPGRSLAKAISWRIIASATTFAIAFFLSWGHKNNTLNESLTFATKIGSIDVVLKIILYYLHERLWTNIQWGKYWKKEAWKRLYRKKHKELEKQK